MKILRLILVASLSIAALGQDTAPPVSLGGSAGITGGQSLTGSNILTHMTDANYTMVAGGWWAGTQIIPSSLTQTAVRTITAPSNPGQPYVFFNHSTGGFADTLNPGGVTIANCTTTPAQCGTVVRYDSASGNYVQVGSSGGGSSGTLTNNTLVGSTTANFLSANDSVGLVIHGDFGRLIANQQLIPSGNIIDNAIGSASLADLLYCPTADGCTAGVNFPFQTGALPLAWPLGITNNTLFVTNMSNNDISNMGDNPTSTDLDYFFHGYLAWIIETGTPDTQKIFANNSTYCTLTGSWTAAGSPYPTGFMKTSTNGATAVCTGFNATDAGMIGLKIGSSTATFSVSVASNGSTYNATDGFNSGGTTVNQTAPYISAWGGDRNLYAFGVPNLPGGFSTITYTCVSAGSDACVIAGPYWLAKPQPQFAPRVLVVGGSYYCGNGSCSIDSGHTDAVVNVVRAQQKAAVSEAKENGINAQYVDPNSTDGLNLTQTAQTGQSVQVTVSSGGSGYSSGVLNFTGCTVNPTGTVPISGGVLTPGTYYTTTGGACNGVTPTVTGTGGSGASITATYISDGTHPNAIGAANIAVVSAQALNSAVALQDRDQASGGTGAPGGSTGNIQYNNGGALAGASGFNLFSSAGSYGAAYLQPGGSGIPFYELSIIGLQTATTLNCTFNGSTWIYTVSSGCSAFRYAYGGGTSYFEMSLNPAGSAGGNVSTMDTTGVTQISAATSSGNQTWFNSQTAAGIPGIFPSNAALTVNPTANWQVDFSGNETVNNITSKQITASNPVAPGQFINTTTPSGSPQGYPTVLGTVPGLRSGDSASMGFGLDFTNAYDFGAIQFDNYAGTGSTSNYLWTGVPQSVSGGPNYGLCVNGTGNVGINFLSSGGCTTTAVLTVNGGISATGTTSLNNLTVTGTCTGCGGSSGLTIGTTTITSGTSGNIEYNNAGVLGEKGVSGTGSVALTASPTFTGTVQTANVNAGSSSVLGWNGDTGISRDSAGVFDFGNGTPSDQTGSIHAASGAIAQINSTNVNSASFSTASNCAATASPAVCSTAAAGSVVIPTGTTSSTLVVNTTAVKSTSQIFFYPDDSLGTRLGVTCNSTLATLAGGSFISARTPGTSFAITFNGSILTNGICGSYFILN